MHGSNKTPLIIGFVVVVGLFPIFGGGAMSGSMMSGATMGQGWIGGFGWVWIPALITLGLGIAPGWMLFGPKK